MFRDRLVHYLSKSQQGLLFIDLTAMNYNYTYKEPADIYNSLWIRFIELVDILLTAHPRWERFSWSILSGDLEEFSDQEIVDMMRTRLGHLFVPFLKDYQFKLEGPLPEGFFDDDDIDLECQNVSKEVLLFCKRWRYAVMAFTAGQSYIQSNDLRLHNASQKNLLLWVGKVPFSGK